jgi:hypothetical protein
MTRRAVPGASLRSFTELSRVMDRIACHPDMLT